MSRLGRDLSSVLIRLQALGGAHDKNKDRTGLRPFSYLLIMKRYIFTIILAIVSMSASAQDILVKRDGMTIKAKVENVTETDVLYKKYNDASQEVLTINISDLLAINYESGETVTFNSHGESHTTNNSLLSEGERMLTDAQLMALSRAEKQGKRLKTVGWVTGVTLIPVGINITTFAFAEEFMWDALLVGISTTVIGAGTGYLLIHNGNKKIRQSQGISTASMFQYEFPLGSNSSMTADVNLMKDDITNQYAPGIGFHINF